MVEDIPVFAAFVPHFPIISGGYAEPLTFVVSLALTLVRRWLFVPEVEGAELLCPLKNTYLNN